MKLCPFCYCLVDSKDLLPHNFQLFYVYPAFYVRMRFCLCVRICLYFAIFMLVFLKFILLDFTMYIFIVKTYIYKNPNLLHLSLLSESLKCSIFVLNLLIAESNTGIGRGSPCWMTIVIYSVITIHPSSLSLDLIQLQDANQSNQNPFARRGCRYRVNLAWL